MDKPACNPSTTFGVASNLENPRYAAIYPLRTHRTVALKEHGPPIDHEPFFP